VISKRRGNGWSSPVFFRGGGASFGAQVGASSTDYFFLLMNDESVDGLMKDRFAFGGEAGVAAGPVGRNAGAGTDALMHAAILSYSRSRGVFAGINLKGVVLKPEDELNLAVYNRTAEELLKDPPDGDSTAESELNAFPRACRYTGKPNVADFLPQAAGCGSFVVMLWPHVWAAAAFTFARSPTSGGG
jgi:lipid-binding SYLF domain-containing protein